MKTLTFGSFSIEIDLDEKGEAHLIEMIKEDITLARKDFKYRLEHPHNPSILVETPPTEVIGQKQVIKSKRRKSKR